MTSGRIIEKNEQDFHRGQRKIISDGNTETSLGRKIPNFLGVGGCLPLAPLPTCFHPCFIVGVGQILWTSKGLVHFST